jgi:3-deoxy-D-manno-octulosonate 8-phosphate phosphatase (KDO 8-P phosphatase)
VTTAAGGRGVAREVADMILGSRMPLEEAYMKAMLPEFEVVKL